MDFNEVLTDSKGEHSSLNGVIYGTRAYNYDKVIAKYQYEIVKQKVEDGTRRGKINFKGHKERLPALKLKQSIIERSNEINAKIRQLSDTIQE